MEHKCLDSDFSVSVKPEEAKPDEVEQVLCFIPRIKAGFYNGGCAGCVSERNFSETLAAFGIQIW